MSGRSEEAHGRSRLSATAVGELVVSLALACLAVFFIVGSAGPRTFNAHDIGPSFYPRLIGFLLIGSAAWRIVLTLRAREASDGWEGLHVPLVTGLWAAIVAYALLWRIGYIPLTLAFVVVVMLIAGVRSWRLLLVSSVAYVTITYLVFARLLFVPLP